MEAGLVHFCRSNLCREAVFRLENVTADMFCTALAFRPQGHALPSLSVTGVDLSLPWDWDIRSLTWPCTCLQYTDLLLLGVPSTLFTQACPSLLSCVPAGPCDSPEQSSFAKACDLVGVMEVHCRLYIVFTLAVFVKEIGTQGFPWFVGIRLAVSVRILLPGILDLKGRLLPLWDIGSKRVMA